jgi:hypothetical protein
MTAANVGMGDTATSARSPWQIWWAVWGITGLSIALIILALDWSAPKSILLQHLEEEAVGMVLVGVLAVIFVFAAMFAIGLIVLGAAFGIDRRKAAASAATTPAKRTDSTMTGTNAD